MAIVYQHRRLDTNEIFYIGVGKDKKRAYSKSGRNIHWQRIVNKYGYQVDILINGCRYDEARNVEIGMIKDFGRSDLGLGSLVNKTDGGEGNINPSKETRKKLSDSKIGKSSWSKNKNFTKEHCKNIAIALKNKPKSKVHIENNKKAAKSRLRITCKYCNNIFDSSNFKHYHGENCKMKPGNENITRKHSKIREKVQCEHCDKFIDPSAYSRWHGNKCKNKNLR
jgi:hypothetical protein